MNAFHIYFKYKERWHNSIFNKNNSINLFFYIISKGELKPKHEDKLIEKIFDAYGERWKEKEIEENIRLHLTNVKKCMEHRDLVCTWFISIFKPNRN